MFKYRIIGFTLLISLLFGIFFWKPWGALLFMISAPAMAAMAIYECCRMLRNSGRENFPKLTALLFYIAAWGVCLSIYLKPGFWGYLILLLLAAVIPLAAGASLLAKDEMILKKVLNSGGVLVIFAPSLLLFCGSYFFNFSGAPYGAWLLFLCLATKATDTGGYIFGMLTAKLPGGNHKIAPNLSPKKSWEGLIGGVLMSLAAGWLFYKYASYASLAWYLGTAALLSLGSFAGDLAESAVKRLCSIKDSGNWVPGMGGAFDVLDSFIFNGIVFTLLCTLL